MQPTHEKYWFLGPEPARGPRQPRPGAAGEDKLQKVEVAQDDPHRQPATENEAEAAATPPCSAVSPCKPALPEPGGQREPGRTQEPDQRPHREARRPRRPAATPGQTQTNEKTPTTTHSNSSKDTKPMKIRYFKLDYLTRVTF